MKNKEEKKLVWQLNGKKRHLWISDEVDSGKTSLLNYIKKKYPKQVY